MVPWKRIAGIARQADHEYFGVELLLVAQLLPD